MCLIHLPAWAARRPNDVGHTLDTEQDHPVPGLADQPKEAGAFSREASGTGCPDSEHVDLSICRLPYWFVQKFLYFLSKVSS